MNLQLASHRSVADSDLESPFLPRTASTMNAEKFNEGEKKGGIKLSDDIEGI